MLRRDHTTASRTARPYRPATALSPRAIIVLLLALVGLLMWMPVQAAAMNSTTYVIGGGPSGYAEVIEWERMFVPLTSPGYSGWGRVSGSHAWCQGGCQATAYEWSAQQRGWYRRSRTRSDDVFIYPYVQGWSWTWTPDRGWLAMPTNDLVVPITRAR